MRWASVVFVSLLGACAPIQPSYRWTDEWPRLQQEVVGVIGGTASCGPVSLRIGFCREDDRETPTRAEAALTDACRGQPVPYLSAFGQTEADLLDRRAVATALQTLFGSAPFDASLEPSDDRALLKTVHDRDQALRFFRPQVAVRNPQIAEHSKWVAICAHGLFARQIVERFLGRTSPEALGADEELANYAWLLVQHSDFDPEFQRRMSQWFGSVDAPHMRRHSAFLHDRAMVGLGRPQRFGTQLRCNEGVREPFPVENQADMDTRRIAIGLRPMSEHLATFPRPCPQPQPRG